MDADLPKQTENLSREEEDMDNVEALMAGVNLEAPEEVGVGTS